MIKVEFIDSMGNAKTAVEAARVSFGGNTGGDLDDKDKKLVKYLADHKHMSPFEHLSLTVKIEVPLYIRSQIMRHRTFSYNEISRRYTDKGLKFYKADTFRKQHESNRQASYGALDKPTEDAVRIEIEEFHKKSMELYESLMAMGVCREQARGVLVQDLMTEFYMTGNLRNFVHFVKLREHEGAQAEVQVVAQKIKDILINKFGYAATVLLED